MPPSRMSPWGTVRARGFRRLASRLADACAYHGARASRGAEADCRPVPVLVTFDRAIRRFRRGHPPVPVFRRRGSAGCWVRINRNTRKGPPMTDRAIRASDKERESVVDVLRDAYTDGRLTLEEFEERTSTAYASKTWADLRELTADLPVEPVLGADLLQQPRPVPAAQMVPSVPRPRQGGRDRPMGRLLPVIFVWIMIAAAAGSPDTAAALSVVFICLLACRVGYGGR
jgi:hypothetical protein